MHADRQINRQTDRQTNRLIAILCTPIGGKVVRNKVGKEIFLNQKEKPEHLTTKNKFH